MPFSPRSYRLAYAALCLSVAALATPASADPPLVDAKDVTAETLSDEHVVAAMTKGITYLLNQQKDGTWENHVHLANNEKCPGAFTSLCTYALLHAHESLDDERVTPNKLAPAIKFLRTLRTDWTYPTGFQISALAMLTQEKQDRLPFANLARPLFRIAPDGSGYRYVISDVGKVSKTFDYSTSQIALLASCAAAETGSIEGSVAFWKYQERIWRSGQRADGGWAYDPAKDGNSRPSMTAAGVASLYLLQEQLPGPVELISRPDKNLEAGLAWLDKNYDPKNHAQPSHYYFLYCLERVGLAAGRKYFGGHDYYRIAAADLVRTQNDDGSWPQQEEWHDAHSLLPPTAFSLIFLARGRNPVAFNKLEYPGNTWNARSRDVAHITAWMSRQFEHAINWQTVGLSSRPEDWLDAPLLLITGSTDPKFTDKDLDKLKTFVESGGIIISSADGSIPAFTTAMQKYAGKITAGQYEWRTLPADHPVFSAWDKTKTPPTLLGLSNGAREVWIHSAVTDLGSLWQRRAYATQDSFPIAANIFFYAAGAKNSLTPKLKSLHVAAPANAPALKISMARLEYAGNWNPEPGAWPRLAKLLRAADAADLNVSNVKIADLDPKNTPVAHLTGTAPFTLPDAQVAKLKAFLDAGGTLLIDNTGGNDSFHASVQNLARALFPADLLTPVPATARMFGADFPAAKPITTVEFRKAARLLSQRGLGRKPNLYGIEKGGRYSLIYAPEDITSGLLGTNTQGIIGYTPDSAVALARNLVACAVAPPPATAPSTATAPAPATAP